jgi:hypothetical protein
MQQNLWQQQAHMANSQAGMPPNSWHLKTISVDTLVFLCFLWLNRNQETKAQWCMLRIRKPTFVSPPSQSLMQM